MASKNTRKRRKSAPSESEYYHRSQDSMSSIFGTLDVGSQLDDSASENKSFKKPRTSSSRRKIVEPLLIRSWNFLMKALSRIPNVWIYTTTLFSKRFLPSIIGNYIVNLSAMVLFLSEVAMRKWNS